MQAPIAEFFSLVPEILVDQAFFHDFAEFPTPDGTVRLAYFTRIAHVAPCDGGLVRNDGKCNGVQLVAYYCDPDGTVYDWEKRYEIESLTSGLHSIFLDSFSSVEGGFAGMCDNILGGFSKMLQQMAAQYLANFVMQQLFGGLSLGNLGSGGAAATGAPNMGVGGGITLSRGAALATGLERVPRDNYPAVLHRNEAVLNAAEAESWRQQQRAKEVAITSSSATARRVSGAAPDEMTSRSSGGNSGDVHLHLHGPTNVNAGQRSQLAGELMGQRLPRRELQRRMQRGTMG